MNIWITVGLMMIIYVSFKWIRNKKKNYANYKLLQMFPKFTEFIYDYMSKQIGKTNKKDFNLLNFGYYNEEAHHNWKNGDKQAFQKMMYDTILNCTIKSNQLMYDKNKKVLEVGCGRGGGIKHLLETNKIYHVTGVDLSNENIKNCENILKKYIENSKVYTVNMKVGNAMHLQLNSNYFDAVINIESSHNYPNFNLFVDQVYKVLNHKNHLS
eukprot:267373_1